MQFIAQGPEEICLSVEHQNPSKTSRSPFGGKIARKGKGKAGGGGELFAQARIWRAVIDFQNGEQQSRSGSDKKRRNGLQ